MGDWAAILLHDGVPVTDPILCHDFTAAEIVAPLVAGWLGGPVSIVQAVVACRPSSDEPSLFDVA